MDEPRPIVELLRIMREWCVEDFEKMRCCGLCSASGRARRDETITVSEMCDFDKYVVNNMPKRKGAYGWTPFKLQPRLDWLQEQIDILTNQNQD